MDGAEPGTNEGTHWDQLVRVPMSLRCAYLSMHRRTNQLIKSLDVTADQYVCLLILNLHGDLIQSEIVKHANSDPNTMKAMLQLLETKGFVVRKVHPSDRRARLVSITQAGEQIVQAASGYLDKVHVTAGKLFTESEARELNLLLERYAELLDPVNGDSE